jgi:hypothetical protein
LFTIRSQHTKTSLFITEDGVETFDGDEYWKVINFICYHVNSSVGDEGKSNEARLDGKELFSTKELAKEYILMNKPCLSLNDVIKHTNIDSVTGCTYLMKLVRDVKLK